jgi:hypothetical protein
MQRPHEQILAGIEQVVRAGGTPVEHVDARIAEVLGVPTGYYLSYLLVWGTIEAHGQALATHGQVPSTAPDPPSGALAQALWLTRRIAGLAGQAHQQATDAGLPDVGERAAKILGAAMELGQALRDLAAAPDDPAAGTDATHRRERGHG